MKFAIILAAAFLALSPARADEAKLSAALDAFEQLALLRDSTGAAAGDVVSTGQIARWTQNLRVRVTGRSSSSELSLTLRVLRDAAEIAGLQVQMLEGEGTDDNFRIIFFPEYGSPPGMLAAGCMARGQLTPRVQRMELYIRSGSRAFQRCVAHEMLHGFGFPGHPHTLDSVMSYSNQGATDWTAIDRYSLRVLYKARFVAGSFHLPALVVARQYMAEDMGLVAAGGDASQLARPVMDRAVARLREQAVGTARNAADIASQLGNAYWFGHHVAVDRAEGVRFWRMAADKEHADARYRLGLAVRDGSGATRDEAEGARLIGLAAAQNHGNAMLEFGRLIRDGRGRAADPVEAHAWLAAAARNNVTAAVAERDALAGRLTPEQLAAANARAAQISPPR